MVRRWSMYILYEKDANTVSATLWSIKRKISILPVWMLAWNQPKINEKKSSWLQRTRDKTSRYDKLTECSKSMLLLANLNRCLTTFNQSSSLRSSSWRNWKSYISKGHQYRLHLQKYKRSRHWGTQAMWKLSFWDKNDIELSNEEQDLCMSRGKSHLHNFCEIVALIKSYGRKPMAGSGLGQEHGEFQFSHDVPNYMWAAKYTFMHKFCKRWSR